MKTLPLNTENFFKRAVSVAEHYGFKNIDDLQTEAKHKGLSVLNLGKEKREESNFEEHILVAILEKCDKATELKRKKPLLQGLREVLRRQQRVFRD